MHEHIRPMRVDDWDSVVAIYAAGIATAHATFQRAAPSYSDWGSSHPEVGRYVLCGAAPPQDIHAWIALSPISSRAVYSGVMELSLYVHPAQQGRGYGRRLMEHMIQLAPSLGIWTLQSTIIRDNHASIQLHRQCGFRKVGYRERIATDIHGKWRDTVIFEKRLR